MADLRDLERLAFHNVHRASRIHTASATPPVAAHAGNLDIPIAAEEAEAVRSAPPAMATASLTMALHSVLPSATKLPLGARVAAATRAVPARGAVTAARPAAAATTADRHLRNAVVPVEMQSGGMKLLSIPASGFSAARSLLSNAGKLFPNPLRRRVGAPPGGSPSGVAARKVGLVWFRNDLRTHDHAALAAAQRECSSLVPVFCFDPRDFGKSASGFDKTGPYRAKFLIECVADLRDKLRELGSELVVRVGRPEEVLRELASAVGADTVFAHQEVTYEELQVERRVGAALEDGGVRVRTFWGSTLYHMDDLPFRLEDMPSNYGSFRERVAGMAVRDCVPTPGSLKGLPAGSNLEPGVVPSLEDLGVHASAAALRSDGQGGAGASLRGGEGEALQRLRAFVSEAVHAAAAPPAKTPAAAAGQPGGSGSSFYSANFSCKISPWLAMGCLSPRRMYEDLRRAQKGGGKADGSGLNWLVFELLWRDFFRFITHKYSRRERGAREALPGPSAPVPAAA